MISATGDRAPGHTPGQKCEVSDFFDRSQGWRGAFYTDPEDPFGQMLVRRHSHALQLLGRYTRLEGKSVFDAGCGPGAYLREMAATAASAYGMDASEEMLRASDEMRREAGAQAKIGLLRGDLERIPVKPGVFDIILCVGVLGYLSGDGKAIGELYRVLAPGGYALFNVRNLNALTSLHYSARLKVKYLLRHGWKAYRAAISLETHGEQRAWKSRAYRLRRLRRLLHGYGFEPVEDFTFGYELKFFSKLGLRGRKIVKLESGLEKMLMAFPGGLFRYAGWGYIGLYRRRP